MKRLALLSCLLVLCAGASAPAAPRARADADSDSSKTRVHVGADRLLTDMFSLVQGKRIGLVTNHSALCTDGTHIADALKKRGVKLTALFGPEHGIRGDAPDGKTIGDSVDAKTGVKVYSLYGPVSKPTPAMLKDVDVLVYDIQDVGARFYTFISTLFLTMEAAAENHIPYIVLDRPNPIRGTYCDGPIRVDSLKSFVGWAPMPIAHGLTVGELATMANGEGWLKDHEQAQLTVVSMEGWKRSMWYDELALAWVRPSPNMRTLRTATVYPGTCLIEGTNVSEGRGTDFPFETIGAPWVSGDSLANMLNEEKLPGVMFHPTRFKPKEMPGVKSPKFNGQDCRGVFIEVTNRDKFEPVKAGIALVAAIRKLCPTQFAFRDRGFDRLAGTPRIREMIIAGRPSEEITASWQDELKQFNKRRQLYFLYQ
jgi:uncharacterized protein YbbC (DUF1343 family)